MTQVCIYPKDAMRILGIGERKAYRLFKNIRAAYNKEKHQFITIKEFCAYTGIDEELLGL